MGSRQGKIGGGGTHTDRQTYGRTEAEAET